MREPNPASMTQARHSAALVCAVHQSQVRALVTRWVRAGRDEGQGLTSNPVGARGSLGPGALPRGYWPGGSATPRKAVLVPAVARTLAVIVAGAPPPSVNETRRVAAVVSAVVAMSTVLLPLR